MSGRPHDAEAALDHYAVLGVTRTATAGEIRSAYYRLVRANTPEDSPEAFRRIAEAFRVLAHPESRARYDAEVPIPPAAERLIAEVSEAMRAGDEKRARRLAGRLYAEHSDHDKVRAFAGEVFARAGAPKSARKVFEDLLESNPDHAVFRKLLGIAFMGLGRLEEAVEQLEESVRLDPDDTDAHLVLCDALMRMEKSAEAVAALDRGIHADGRADLVDLPLLIRKVLVLARVRDWDGLESTAAVLVAIVPPDDPDARDYVANELMRVARIFDEAGQPHLTKYVVDCARRLLPDQDWLAELSTKLAPASEIHRELEAVEKDEHLPEWLRGWMAARYGDRSEEEVAQIEAAIRADLGKAEERTVTAELRRFASAYPALHREIGPPASRMFREVCRTRDTARKDRRILLILFGIGLLAIVLIQVMR